MNHTVAHVKSTLEAADFYLNKILSNSKDLADPEKSIHRNFVSGIKSIIADSADYVKANHLTGLTWNPKGGDLQSYNGSGSGSNSGSSVPSAPPASSGSLPPPPPPVDPNIHISSSSKSEEKKAVGGMAAVFGELNKGEGITSGLKKVTSDMKAKNMKDM